MKLNRFILILTLCSCILSACSGGRRRQVQVADVAVAAFGKHFPGISAKDWNTEGKYATIRFKQDGRRCKAWFDNDEWVMTTVWIQKEELPAKTLDAFQGGVYAEWELTGCRRFDRRERDTVFVLDVEKNKVKYGLYYNRDGILVRAVNATEQRIKASNLIPKEAPECVFGTLRRLYPDAVIFEVASNGTSYAIDIVDGGLGKKAFIDNSGKWLYTICEIGNPALIPDAVKSALNRKYDGSRISDNAVLTQSSGKETYTFYLAKDGGNYTVVLDSRGNFLR